MRTKRDDYELIGKEVGMFDIALDPAAAYELRDFVAQDFLPHMMRAASKQTLVKHLDEHTDRTLFKIRFGRNAYSNPEGDIVNFTGVNLHHYDLNSWKLVALITKYRQDNTPNKIAVRYRINMFEDRLFEARREVRIIRSNSDEVFAHAMQSLEDDQDYMPPAERVAFERPLTNENVGSLQEHLQQVAKRCIATA